MEEKKDETGSNWADEWERHKPLGTIVGTFVAIIAWLVFILLYALYWSKSFDLFQNVVVALVSLVIMGLVIGLMWTVYGMRHARHWGPWGDWNRPK
jgi:hypothetical protein